MRERHSKARSLVHDFSVKLSPCMCGHVSCPGWRNSGVYECCLCMVCYLKRPTVDHDIKSVPPMSCLPSSVEAQTSATRLSPGTRRCTLTVAFHWPSRASHDVDHHEIFECTHLKFTVSGRCIKDWLRSLKLWGSVYQTITLWPWYLVRAYLSSNSM